MKAFLKNYRQSPRKVRTVANLVCGKGVEAAIVQLNFLPNRAGTPIAKLILSAAANAKANFNIEKENLIIKELRVDKGIVMKRMMPAAMGTGHRINKRTSHITILLAEKEIKGEKTIKPVKVEKAEKPVKTEKVTKAEKVTAKAGQVVKEKKVKAKK